MSGKAEKYRVTRTKLYGKGGDELEVGSAIMLTPEQAASRSGKVEPWEAPKAEKPSELDENTVELLNGGGFDTPEKIKEASDDTLLDIEGIGKGTLKKIREFYSD